LSKSAALEATGRRACAKSQLAGSPCPDTPRRRARPRTHAYVGRCPRPSSPRPVPAAAASARGFEAALRRASTNGCSPATRGYRPGPACARKTPGHPMRIRGAAGRRHPHRSHDCRLSAIYLSPGPLRELFLGYGSCSWLSKIYSAKVQNSDRQKGQNIYLMQASLQNISL
jgi:hypothetical protein